jgi:hypothetical protein
MSDLAPPQAPPGARVDQSAFRRAILDPLAPVPDGLRDGQGRPAGRRFAVYRNNVAVGLSDALADGFPALRAILGEDEFRAMAAACLRLYPPKSPLMMEYGAELPAFLEAATQSADHPWLADLARLECALRASYHAADAPVLSPADLSTLPPEQLGGARFTLHPSVHQVRSDWPVASLWRAARTGQTSGLSTPDRRSENALIARQGFDPDVHLLLPGDATFVDRLRQGATLETEAVAAQTSAPDHDPTPILTLLMTTDCLTGVEIDHD